MSCKGKGNSTYDLFEELFQFRRKDQLKKNRYGVLENFCILSQPYLINYRY